MRRRAKILICFWLSCARPSHTAKPLVKYPAQSKTPPKKPLVKDPAQSKTQKEEKKIVKDPAQSKTQKNL